MSRMTRADLDEFVSCYNPANWNQRKATWAMGKHPDRRWRAFTYDEIVARDKCSLDVFWLWTTRGGLSSPARTECTGELQYRAVTVGRSD
jgi:hypothetical protein